MMYAKTRARLRTILRFCNDYAQSHGWAASDREIAAGTGTSPSMVKYYMHKLDAAGYVVYVGSRQVKVLSLL